MHEENCFPFQEVHLSDYISSKELFCFKIPPDCNALKHNVTALKNNLTAFTHNFTTLKHNLNALKHNVTALKDNLRWHVILLNDLNIVV